MILIIFNFETFQLVSVASTCFQSHRRIRKTMYFPPQCCMQLEWIFPFLVGIIFWLLFGWHRVVTNMLLVCWWTFNLFKYIAYSTAFFTQKYNCHFLLLLHEVSYFNIVWVFSVQVNSYAYRVCSVLLEISCSLIEILLCIGILHILQESAFISVVKQLVYCFNSLNVFCSRRCRTKYKAMKPEVIDALNKMKVTSMLFSLSLLFLCVAPVYLWVYSPSGQHHSPLPLWLKSFKHFTH